MVIKHLSHQRSQWQSEDETTDTLDFPTQHLYLKPQGCTLLKTFVIVDFCIESHRTTDH